MIYELRGSIRVSLHVGTRAVHARARVFYRSPQLFVFRAAMYPLCTAEITPLSTKSLTPRYVEILSPYSFVFFFFFRRRNDRVKLEAMVFTIEKQEFYLLCEMLTIVIGDTYIYTNV